MEHQQEKKTEKKRRNINQKGVQRKIVHINIFVKTKWVNRKKKKEEKIMKNEQELYGFYFFLFRHLAVQCSSWQYILLVKGFCRIFFLFVVLRLIFTIFFTSSESSFRNFEKLLKWLPKIYYLSQKNNILLHFRCRHFSFFVLWELRMQLDLLNRHKKIKTKKIKK